MTEFTLSVAQFAATRDTVENLKAAQTLIARAGATSDLVVLPENAMYSDPAHESAGPSYSESLEGEFVSALRASASTQKIHVVAGFTETNNDDRPFNTLVHIDRDGNLAGVYRKIHLYDAFGYRESDTISPAPAESPLLFDINGISVGAATCYDLRFPEMARWLVDHSADVILYPAAWAVGPMKESHWESLIRARAIENTVYVAAAGQTAPFCTGQSQIVDPMGTTIASAGTEQHGIATALIRAERIHSARESNPCLLNRRFAVAPRA
ncbi:carbon-nitrogen hydrolase family protein [Leucobacter sp. PH1c]|uniref:carbon-nitrogen hydrolase family protein n=1 Tax=Leucobacter sp. PH1c TaxID=1397278 RepID=UPI0004687677|nr:carbon-nitrogen hydrolase family protein [Leucobacter sp. PH1c]